jgi:FkbM family methyltransferase
MKRRDFLTGAAIGVAGGTALGAAGAVTLPDLGGQQSLIPALLGRGHSRWQERISFSQMGEDLVLFALLHDTLKIAMPTYLDIGAADPVEANNSYLLYWRGSHGVLVEPNPAYVDRIRAVRPRDAVVAAGVGVGDTDSADYYVIKGQPMLNTFSPELVEKLRQKAGQEVVERVMKMPLVGINTLVEKHFGTAPDLFSIDVEGLDLAILKTMDFEKHRPPVICAETKGPGYSHESTAVATFLAAKGYLVTAGTLYNTIFVDRARLGA